MSGDGLITWSLAEGFFPRSHPGWAQPACWIVGFLAAILLFAIGIGA